MLLPPSTIGCLERFPSRDDRHRQSRSKPPIGRQLSRSRSSSKPPANEFTSTPAEFRAHCPIRESDMSILQFSAWLYRTAANDLVKPCANCGRVLFFQAIRTTCLRCLSADSFLEK